MAKVETEFKIADQTTKLVVHKPSAKDEQEAEFEYAKVFTARFRNKELLSEEVEAAARERGLITDAHVARRKELAAKFAEDERVVRGKVKGTTKTEGRAAAVRMLTTKGELDTLDSLTDGLSAMTVQAKAGEARDAVLLYRCTRGEDGKPFFPSKDDALARPDGDPAKSAAYLALVKVMRGYDPVEAFQKRPEIAFLLKYGFGRLTEDGRFQFVDPVTGAQVDADGQPVDKEADEVFEFLD